ncbi:MAG: hypothetical protein KatS3mg076_3015 [Candidatus Binatia bacterium]|nr:MAG: hypothetical protein KatS3mg076_3015 [Candidatus Binatia bacterium]
MATAKIMLGFLVRRCSAELGHDPTPEEFARWANQRTDHRGQYCLFGRPISEREAAVILATPGRLVRVQRFPLEPTPSGAGPGPLRIVPRARRRRT